MAAIELMSLPANFMCTNLHVKMMHIQHPSKQQDDLCEFLKLREDETFTDMTFCASNARCLKVHSLVLAATSDFLRTWMENTHIPDMIYHISLPDVEFETLQALINILYGVDVSVAQDKLDDLHSLADVLGITVDLPFRITEQPFPSDSVTMSVGEKVTRDLEDDNAGVDVLPLCCWHCNRSFADLEELKSHVKTHKGETFKSKRHKCQKCKKVLASMWKLRQHLLTHATSLPNRKKQPAADHQYADTSQAANQPSQYTKKDNSDHPYATPPSSIRNTEINSEAKVSLDHSYGTPYEPDVEMGGSSNQDRRYDHPYSATRPEKRSKEPETKLSSSFEDEEGKDSQNKQDAQVSPRVSPPRGAAKRKASLQPRKGSKNQHGGLVMSPNLVAKTAIVVPPQNDNNVVTKLPLPPLKPKPAVVDFPCDQCDKRFPQRYRRVRHIREVHDKEKLHKCSCCEKSFFKITSRDRHELTHSQNRVRNWACTHCAKNFTEESSLSYHVKHRVCVKRIKPKSPQ